MADERRRDLERRWADTGEVSDEAALLGVRLRTGALSVDRLEVAAFSGHPAARAVLGAAAPPVPEDLDEWLRGLERWSARLAAWAVSCAAVADEHEGGEAARVELATMHASIEAAFRRGGSLLIDASWAPWRLPHDLSAKAGRVRVAVLDVEWRSYLVEGDPELERAIDALWGQAADAAEAERWSYDHTAPAGDGCGGWYHCFAWQPAPGRVIWRLIEAEDGWSPGALGADRVPPGRIGALARFRLPLADPDRAGVAARRAVVAWALGGLPP